MLAATHRMIFDLLCCLATITLSQANEQDYLAEHLLVFFIIIKIINQLNCLLKIAILYIITVVAIP